MAPKNYDDFDSMLSNYSKFVATLVTMFIVMT